MAATQQFVGSYRMYHLIRAGALYEIWAVRPMSETTAYAMKWLPPGPKYSRTTVGELKHEYQVGIALEHPSVIKTYDFDGRNQDWFRAEVEILEAADGAVTLAPPAATEPLRIPYEAIVRANVIDTV